MEAFANLLERLLLTPSRNGKLALMANYFATIPDPERGWALAALTNEIDLPGVKAGLVRRLVLVRALEHGVLGVVVRSYVGPGLDGVPKARHGRHGGWDGCKVPTGHTRNEG